MTAATARRDGAAAVARLALAEVRLYAVCAAACATNRPVTLRQLAAVTGPNGHPVGLRSALETVRDLADAGLLTTPGLALTTPDSPRRVHVPGCAAQSAPAVTVPAPATRTYAPPQVVGRLGRLDIPATLPAELRTRLITLSAEIRSVHKAHYLPGELLDLRRRKAAALTEWAALCEDPGHEVHEALGRAMADEKRAEQVYEQWMTREEQTQAALKAARNRPAADLAEPLAPVECDGVFKSGMPIPTALPEELRTELLVIAEAFRGGGPSDRRQRMDLSERRAAALAQWAAHPTATHKVVSEAERAHTALANARANC
ncbi:MULTISPECIES: hypothetical protein [Streptomyces]|uniref:Uncharacterized protein n=2 Tax=Streptomyces TaxID=1883 RepID=A0ABU4KDM6_9ACTN|nr:hypothetical protein [Streptomyces roseolus]MDX2295878.1 hypothetical protein [Streptomyces roseolus]